MFCKPHHVAEVLLWYSPLIIWHFFFKSVNIYSQAGRGSSRFQTQHQRPLSRKGTPKTLHIYLSIYLSIYLKTISVYKENLKKEKKILAQCESNLLSFENGQLRSSIQSCHAFLFPFYFWPRALKCIKYAVLHIFICLCVDVQKHVLDCILPHFIVVCTKCRFTRFSSSCTFFFWLDVSVEVKNRLNSDKPICIERY